MSKNNNLENAYLGLFFNGTPIADVADNDATSPATNVVVALHTADPGEAGTPATNETAYSNYARQNVARTSGGWTITGNSVSPNADIDFPAAGGVDANITHASISIGNFMYKGALNAPIVVVPGTIPRILAGSTITED